MAARAAGHTVVDVCRASLCVDGLDAFLGEFDDHLVAAPAVGEGVLGVEAVGDAHIEDDAVSSRLLATTSTCRHVLSEVMTRSWSGTFGPDVAAVSANDLAAWSRSSGCTSSRTLRPIHGWVSKPSMRSAAGLTSCRVPSGSVTTMMSGEWCSSACRRSSLRRSGPRLAGAR